MDERAFAILFVVVGVIAIGVLSVTKLTSNFAAASPSPSASADTIKFAGDQNPPASGAQQTVNNQQTQPAATQIVRKYAHFPGTYPVDQLKGKKAVIATNKGTIEFEILPESPKAASNFIYLALNQFYNGLTFHRVEPGFVIQGGDPAGNGTGGPGYQFEDEPVTLKYDKGMVAMANAGPNTNGSQFFIMLDNHAELPPNYTIFGKVIKGQDVVDKIAVGDVMQQVAIAQE